jgi:hypothetical protein
MTPVSLLSSLAAFYIRICKSFRSQFGEGSSCLRPLFVQVVYSIQVQMLEIYNESLRDLLLDTASASSAGNRLELLATQASGCNVPGATQVCMVYCLCNSCLACVAAGLSWISSIIMLNILFQVFFFPSHSQSFEHAVDLSTGMQITVADTADVMAMMARGARNRHSAETKMNSRSSRSHQVLTVIVDGANRRTGARSHGCLHLVDLAGSERTSKSEATGELAGQADRSALDKAFPRGPFIHAATKSSTRIKSTRM